MSDSVTEWKGLVTGARALVPHNDRTEPTSVTFYDSDGTMWVIDLAPGEAGMKDARPVYEMG